MYRHRPRGVQVNLMSGRQKCVWFSQILLTTYDHLLCLFVFWRKKMNTPLIWWTKNPMREPKPPTCMSFPSSLPSEPKINWAIRSAEWEFKFQEHNFGHRCCNVPFSVVFHRLEVGQGTDVHQDDVRHRWLTQGTGSRKGWLILITKDHLFYSV